MLTQRPPPLHELLRDLWHCRELIGILARRNFFTRYRRAAFGVGWAIFLPLIQAAVMAVVFRYVVRIRTAHYPLFLFAGIFAWTFFSTSLTAGATSIVDNSSLSSKIYFPRATLPIVTVLANSYTLVVSLVLLIVAEPLFKVWPAVHNFLLVPAALLALLLSLALSLLLSALHVYFRDIRYIVTAAVTVWFYATPIFYPLSLLQQRHVPAIFRYLIQINPATGMVELFHAAITGADSNWAMEAVICLGWVVGIFALGLWIQHRYDRLLADLL